MCSELTDCFLLKENILNFFQLLWIYNTISNNYNKQLWFLLLDLWDKTLLALLQTSLDNLFREYSIIYLRRNWSSNFKMCNNILIALKIQIFRVKLNLNQPANNLNRWFCFILAHSICPEFRINVWKFKNGRKRSSSYWKKISTLFEKIVESMKTPASSSPITTICNSNTMLGRQFHACIVIFLNCLAY